MRFATSSTVQCFLILHNRVKVGGEVKVIGRFLYCGFAAMLQEIVRGLCSAGSNSHVQALKLLDVYLDLENE